MNYAIIGMGFIYDRHVQAIKETGGRILMTCDIDSSKNPDFTDWLEMYNHPKFKEKVDAVIICTPNYLHGAMAREASLRGKRVLCEKPLTIDEMSWLEGVKTVLQLRNNPKVQGLRRHPPTRLKVVAKMFRDESYWNGWKGDDVKSGGILYNLGVHYIDLLVYILGDKYEVWRSEKTNRLAKGMIKFGDRTAEYHIEIVKDRKDQGRKLIADGRTINLSSQDNLSYENLHTEVYRHFERGRGVGYKSVTPTMRLLRKLNGD